MGVVMPSLGAQYASGPGALAGPLYEGGGSQLMVARTTSNQLNAIFGRAETELIP